MALFLSEFPYKTSVLGPIPTIIKQQPLNIFSRLDYCYKASFSLFNLYFADYFSHFIWESY
jgi:hypothetical protein